MYVKFESFLEKVTDVDEEDVDEEESAEEELEDDTDEFDTASPEVGSVDEEVAEITNIQFAIHL